MTKTFDGLSGAEEQAVLDRIKEGKKLRGLVTWADSLKVNKDNLVQLKRIAFLLSSAIEVYFIENEEPF